MGYRVRGSQWGGARVGGRRAQTVRQIAKWLLVGALLLGLMGCSQAETAPIALPVDPAPQSLTPRASVEVVEPPGAIALLNLTADTHQPSVAILGPKPDEVLTDTTVRVRLRVRDLPIYNDNVWQLGPHLHVVLDGQQTYSVYDAGDPLVLSDLTPGTHTLRVLAAKPWHESYKNIDAYAQTTFHVFAKTGENQPTPEQPQLIYSQPEGHYGAEPILLDFYLTDVPLHLIAQESDLDDVKDWHLRCTVNGESLRVDTWEPVYLKGLKPGQNWVQLVLEDEDDRPIVNAFNNVARLIEYRPDGTDPLSQLMRGELTAAELTGIVDPSYVPPAPPEPPASPEPPALPEPPAPASEPESEPTQAGSAAETAPAGATPPALEVTPPTSSDGAQSAELNLSEPISETKAPAPEPLVPDLNEPSLTVPELTEPALDIPGANEPNAASELDNPALDKSEGEKEETESVEALEPVNAETAPTETDPTSSVEYADDDVTSVPLEEPTPPESPGPSDDLQPAASPAETVDAQIEDLTVMDAEQVLPPGEDVPDIVDVIEAEIESNGETEPEPNSGRRLLKRLYDYRDRSLKTYGNR
ncbi:MAG: hypothetical protein AAFR42_07920 [Cyanobacteria bacterium J06628_6]